MAGTQRETGEGRPGWARRLTRYCWQYRRNVLLSLGASLIGMGIMALVPLIPRLIIDDVVVAAERDLAPWATLMIVAAAAVYGLTFVRRFYGGRLALDVQHDLRTDMFDAINRMDGRRQDELSTGQVVGRGTSDLQLVQSLLFMIPMMIGNVLLFAVSLVVMVVLSPLLTVVALAVAPLLWWIANLSRTRLFPATWYAQQQAGVVASVVDGAITGVRVVKGFGQERQETGKLRAIGRKLFAARVRTVRLNARYTPAMQAVPLLGQVGMLALGGWMAARGQVTLGTFVAFSTYLAQLVGPVRMLAMMLTIGQQARAGVERVFDLIDTEPEVEERTEARELPADAPASVEFDDVTFGYDPDHPVLDGFSLRIEPGETVAVVGTSGSGKSTVSLLLPRYYDVTGGAVRVGGHDVRHLTLSSLRAAIGLVPENSFLFSASIRENIAFGRPDATDERIRAAARAAQADGFISELPQEYDTTVGEQGLTLSGGQRQRIALARAILTDPRLLLLDDATSAVDARVEHEIHGALRGVMAGRTTLLIAHRMSTLALADRIAVLDGGRLVDVGTQAELEERCGLFRRLLTDPDELAGVERDPAGLAAGGRNVPYGSRSVPSGNVRPERTAAAVHADAASAGRADGAGSAAAVGWAGSAGEAGDPEPNGRARPDGSRPNGNAVPGSEAPADDESWPASEPWPDGEAAAAGRAGAGSAGDPEPNGGARPDGSRPNGHAVSDSEAAADDESWSGSEPWPDGEAAAAGLAVRERPSPGPGQALTSVPGHTDGHPSPGIDSHPRADGHPHGHTDSHRDGHRDGHADGHPHGSATDARPHGRADSGTAPRTTNHLSSTADAPSAVGAAPTAPTAATTEAEAEAAPRGVTPELWVRKNGHHGSATQPADGTPDVRSAPSAPGGHAPAGMHGGGMAGALAGMPGSPELLAKVAALPPATDSPDIDEDHAERPEDSYGLRRLLRGFGAPLALALLFVALDAIAGLLLPVTIRQGIDEGVQRQALDAVWAASLLALIVVGGQWVVQIVAMRLTGATGERVLYVLRVKIFAQLQRLGLDYYERHLTGKIMTRMTTDVDALSTFLQTGLVTAVVSLLTFFGILIALLLIDTQLALVVFATLPPLIVGTFFFRRQSVKAYELARERVSAVNGDLQEGVAGLRIVQAFRRERSGAQRFAARSDAYRQARVRGQWLISIYFPFVQLLSSVAAAGVLIAGAGRVSAGTLTAGALVAYLLYIDLFFAPVQQLSQVFDGYQQAAVSLGRIQELLREPTSTPVAAEPRTVEELHGEVTFDDVHFRYSTADGDEEAPALNGIHLTIPAGQTVAFVGQTGAGKSTLIKLVARFYDPTAGTVRVDGMDLRELDPTSYRHHLGVVPQEPYLFPGTVRDAIAYGRSDATDADVEAAARAVGAHAMIASLSDGYLHPVGERGRNLSAGQRQLLALARAELVDPDILLLDEATAALDLATEAVVNQATDRLTGRRTTLVIAHRLTTAARADRVVVLDHGRVVEDGTHEELLARGGHYTELWRAFTGEAVGAAPV